MIVIYQEGLAAKKEESLLPYPSLPPPAQFALSQAIPRVAGSGSLSGRLHADDRDEFAFAS